MSKVIDLDKIIEKMNTTFQNKNLTELEKARYLYIELGKKLQYDINYDTDFEIKERDVYFKPIDLDNIQTNSYVCTQISKMYTELLNRAGIQATTEKTNNDIKMPHVFTSITLKDGRKILTDLTLDLSNIQKGLMTEYFGYLDEDGYTKIDNDELDRIDSNIGYKYKMNSNQSEYTDYFIKALKDELEDEDKLRDYIKNSYSEQEWKDYKPEYLVRYKFDVISRFLKINDMGFREGDNFLRYLYKNFFTNEEKKYFNSYKVSNEVQKEGTIVDTEEIRCYKLKAKTGEGYEYYIYEKGQNLRKIDKEELRERLSRKKYISATNRRAENLLEL